MSVLQRAFWKTIWEDWRMLLIAIIVVVVIIGGIYSWFQMKRSWNWNIGGYKSRAHDMVCEMVQNGALAKGPNYLKECK